MARDFYGYGRWSAPYWFIGLEQGGTDNHRRAQAFKELQSDGLCDCKKFHIEIGVTDLHGENAKVQKTWGRLMMTLMSFLGTKENLLSYQREEWGMVNGKTCVIELSGLAAAGLHIEVDRRSYLAERIDFISRKLRENRPQLAVMYGFTRQNDFETIAGCGLVRGGVVENQGTLFVYTNHPTHRLLGNNDEAWRKLGLLARAGFNKIDSRSSLVEGLNRGISTIIAAEKHLALGSGELNRELWLSLASLLRSYTAVHGLHNGIEAAIDANPHRITAMNGARWLHLERQSSAVAWTRENGTSGVLELTDHGRLRSPEGEEEMDMAAEAWARELMQ